MDQFSFKELLIENPVVGAIRNHNELKKIVASKVKIVFVLYGSITNIKEICGMLKNAGKVVFVHESWLMIGALIVALLIVTFFLQLIMFLPNLV